MITVVNVSRGNETPILALVVRALKSRIRMGVQTEIPENARPGTPSIPDLPFMYLYSNIFTSYFSSS